MNSATKIPAELAGAAAEYEAFHWGRRPRKISRARVSAPPRRLVKLGKLEAVTYSTTKGHDGHQHYEHEFEDPKPTLGLDFDTRRLHVVGGGYTITRRGIER